MTTTKTPADDLLDRLAEFGSEFDGLANHEPMVIAALELLGAPAERLSAFTEAYHRTNAVEPFGRPQTPVTDATWESCLGRRDREPDLREYFLGQVGDRGIAGTVSRFLPRLAPGVSGSAFHPLMRLAYATLRQDGDETARALAYWTATYLDLPDGAGVAPLTDDPGRVLELVAGEESLRVLPTQYLLWHNIRQMGQAPAFAPVVGWLRIDEDTMGKMAASSIALYAATMDFCALHAVTGTHWIRVVTADHPELRPVLLRHFWQGVAGLMGEMGFPELPDPADVDRRRHRPDLPSWEEIREAATRSTDEHDVSLTFSAWQEDLRYGDDLYRYAAARRVGLIAES